MSVKIKRNTGYLGKFSPLKVTLNGKKVTELYNNTETDVTLSEERMLLGVKEFGTNSNKIEVSDGNEVLVKNRRLNTVVYTIAQIIMYLIPLFIVFKISFTENYTLGNITKFIFVFLGAALVIMMFLSIFKIYQLENVTKDVKRMSNYDD